jgi:hypothetical protein
MKDKSNRKVDLNWCEKFNDWVDKHSLLEINLLGRCFTWSNNQENVIISHIDRVFCTTEFDAKFPLPKARALSKSTSYHVPILWEAGLDNKKYGSRFKLEKWWLQHKDFKEIVKQVWSTPVEGRSALDRWQNRVISLRKKAKGWNRNVEVGIRKEKHELKTEYDRLDILSESKTLTPQEREQMCSVNASLEKILDMEEVKARQKSRERNIKEGIEILGSSMQ